MKKHLWIVVGLLLCAGAAFAGTGTYGIRADAPSVTVDPVMDGASTFAGEWADALALPDGFTDPFTGVSPAGYFYYQTRVGWEATSAVAGNTATYPGSTAFIAHDIYGDGPPGAFQFFRVNNALDWNYVKVRRSDGSITECWNFGGFVATPTPPHAPPNHLNEADDGLWITAAGTLAASSLISAATAPDLIRDVGFIVRKDEDPLTDKQWFPGMDEPGDPGWDWDDFYGCFARAGFNASFFLTDDDASPDAAAHSDPNEVYEWCFREWAEGGPPLDCTTWCFEWIDPPKYLVIYIAANWFIHWGDPPPVPATPTSMLLLLGALLALGGFLVLRRRRRSLVVLLFGLALMTIPGCGGSGGTGTTPTTPKVPPVIEVPPLVPHNGYAGQPYPIPGGPPAINIPVIGGVPPYNFVVTAGALPPNVILSPIGQILSDPPLTPIPPGSEGAYDFQFSVTDSNGDSATAESSLRIEEQVLPTFPAPPVPPIPIQLVQLDLVSVAPIDLLMGPINTPMAGAVKVRGGDPNFPYQFSEFPPGQLAAPPFNSNFTLSQGGILAGQSPVPFGPQPLQVQVINGAPPVFLILFVQVTP